MNARTAAALAALFVLVAGSGGPPAARAGGREGAPRQVRLPFTGAAEVEGLEAAVGHAAGLGFLEGAELGAGWSTRLDGGGAADGVLGAGAFRLGPLGLGLGLSRTGAGIGIEDAMGRLDLAVALRLAARFSLGLRWTRLSGDVEALDGWRSLSLSTTVRPARTLSVALGLDRLGGPKIGTREDDLLARAAVALRPGTERVAFGLDGASTLAESPSWFAGASLRLMPFEGVVVGGYGRYHRHEHPDFEDEIEWGAYVALEQGGAGVEAGVDRVDAAGGQDVASTMDLSVLARVRTEPATSVVAPPSRVVRVSFDGPIPERWESGLGGSDRPPLGYVLDDLSRLASDPDVAGIVLDVGEAPGWAQMWEIRQVLAKLRARGKRVVARLAWADMKAMYLASAADRILLHPAGGLELAGLAVTRSYFKDLLGNLGVQAQFVAFEDYKSAPEALTRTGPTDPAREQSLEVLGAFDREWRDAIRKGRGLDDAAVDRIVAASPQTMETAHEDRLVDRVVPDDRLEVDLSEDLGRRVEVVEGHRPRPRAWRRWVDPPRIAIVPVVGSIVEGGSSDLPVPILGQTTGDRDFVRAIEESASDDRVAGIVVRVSSPGGGVVASDRMHRAVVRAAEKKPVAVSFGDVAASGGYYLAAGSPRIYATPLTVTGSIGIFTGKVEASRFFEVAGIGNDVAKTAPMADHRGLHRPWTEAELVRVRERLADYYERFLTLVSQGRRLPLEKVRERAGGRVYAGERALALQLVDESGSLLDAVARVREAARAPDARIHYAGAPGFLDRLLGPIAATRSEVPAPRLLAPDSRLLAPLLGWLATLEHIAASGVQARLPYDLEVR